MVSFALMWPHKTDHMLGGNFHEDLKSFTCRRKMED